MLIATLIFAGAGLTASFLDINGEPISGVDLWGGRAPHPAVVNPVLGDEPGSVLSLRGTWEFCGRSQMSIKNHFPGQDRFYRNKKGWRDIEVPACWESQGVGVAAQGVCWDMYCDHNEKPIRHKHLGYAGYRKTVTIPAEWAGKRIWLKAGGIKSKGWIHVNEKDVGLVENYCGTVKYDITDLVEPGRPAMVAVQVGNSCPSRKGLMSAMNRWGGIYRDIELEATPRELIDDAWVRGDFDKKTAEAHVDIAFSEGKGAKLRFTVEGGSVEVAAKGGENVLRLPLKRFRAWSPEHPNLYTGIVELVRGGTVVQTRRERFGVRKLEVRGKEFYLNGKPFFFRAFGDDHVYPLSGLTPADRDVHRAHLALAHRAGFNCVRLHTHCEVPEYFEAADELGIFIQAELPYYNDAPTEGFSFDPVRDVTELYRNYRRHPSFGIYSMGNEGTYGPKLDSEIHRYVKAMDPDRLKINQDCQVATINPPESADYVGGPVKPWPRGTVDFDRPFVAHEYLNLCVKSDSRLEPKFTGVWLPPVTRAAREKWLAKFGLDLDWGDRLQDAQHVLQSVYQKRGLESARADPYCDGYCFWTIVDVVVKNLETYSAQGLLNPFWERKSGGFSVEDVSRFNSASCIMLDRTDANHVYTTGERFAMDLLLAHYGESPLAKAVASWRLVADDRALASGRIDVGDQAVGGVRKIGRLDFALPEVARPVAARLEIGIGRIANVWDVWVFPKRPVADGRRIAATDALRAKLAGAFRDVLPIARAAEAETVIAEYGSDAAKQALARGQRVITVEGAEGQANVSLGWWWMGEQVGMALKKDRAFGLLPHEGHLSPLLFRVVKRGRKLPVEGFARDEMLAVGEGGEACFLYLAKKKVGKGEHIACFGLNLFDTPEGLCILDGLLATTP